MSLTTEAQVVDDLEQLLDSHNVEYIPHVLPTLKDRIKYYLYELDRHGLLYIVHDNSSHFSIPSTATLRQEVVRAERVLTER